MEALTVVEVAEAVKLCTRHVWREVKAGRFIPPFYIAEKSPRWLRSDLEKFLAEKAAAASASKAGKTTNRVEVAA